MTVLYGPDHVDYGAVEGVVAAPGVALAITRGLHPKPYRWTDPNEDVVAAVAGPRATLLVVADAHNGALSSQVAVRTVLDQLGDDPSPELDDPALVALFHRASTAVLAATRETDDEERRASRTTLSMALVAERRLCWAAMGDSPVLVAEGDVGLELTRGDHAFVGWPMTAARVDRLLQRGRGSLGPGAWVALTSDGFSNFCDPSAPAAAAKVLADAPDALAGARGLVEHAFTCGAGDNVAAVVVAPPGSVSG